MDSAARRLLEQDIGRELRARFPGGNVSGVAVLPHGDDAELAPGELLVRVFIGRPGGAALAEAAGPDEFLAAWQRDHAKAMSQVRRELSLRLPQATILQFTVSDDHDGSHAVTLRHDPETIAAPMTAAEVVQAIADQLRSMYVLPERAEQAAGLLEARLAAGEYDGLAEAELAELLTDQLQQVCSDKHLQVLAHEAPQPGQSAGPEAPAERPAWRKPESLHNYGIVAVERLDGNVGYIDLRGIARPENAGQAIAAAMQLVAGTDALILDLRNNGGGSPDGVVVWCSYLLDGAGIHLNDIHVRQGGQLRQFWSLGYLPGDRYTDRPVYVLSSGQTFSGGEDLCYTLQALGRAKVIGETTGGGAHPTTQVPISPTIAVAVPFARSVNPVTGTNWEGTGVTPDIAVPAKQAYDVAYRLALEHVLASDAPPPLREEAQETLDFRPDPRAGAGPGEGSVDV
jgi:hypothetical protein